MKSRKVQLILVIIFSILAISCGKKRKAMKFTLSEFPINVGNQWAYISTAQGSLGDTLILKVVDNISSNSDEDVFQCHIIFRNTLVDSAQFAITENDIFFRQVEKQAYRYFSEFHLNGPFQEGDNWSSAYFDTVQVTSYLEDYEGYDDVFLIERDDFSFHYHLSQSIYIAPNVGIVEQDFSEFLGGPTFIGEFKLIEYSLK